MNPPLISVLTPHWNRPDHLRDYLKAMALQTYSNFEILLHDDGSLGPCLALAEAMVEELGPAANVAFFGKHKRLYRPDDIGLHHPGRAQWARQYNKLFPRSKGAIVGILSSDWMPEPDFLQAVVDGLQELGSGNMIFGDVPNQAATKPAIPHGATTGHYEVLEAGAADTRNQNFVWREDWADWDESFDDIGFGHAMPYWLHDVQKHGSRLWVSLDMKAAENEHGNPEEFTDQILESSPHYMAKLRALRGA